MEIPEISVLLAVYNGEKYIEDSIKSIQEQTCSNWEFILINDGSTDRTARILDRLAKEDSRLKIIHQKNQGLTKSLNQGLLIARGRYIARLDCGDSAEKQRLETQKAFLDSNPDHVAVGGYALFITTDNLPVYIYKPPLTHHEIDANQIAGHSGQIAHACLMVRKMTIDCIGGYCEDFPFAQDTDLLLRLAETGFLANLNRIAVYYRLDSKSISSVKRIQQIHYSSEALRRARLRRGLPPIEIQLNKWAPKNECDLLISWVQKAIADGNYQTSLRLAWQCLQITPTILSIKLFIYSIIKIYLSWVNTGLLRKFFNKRK